jgi:hypothetical protein
LSPAHIHISKVSVYHEGAAKEAAKLGREALGDAADVSYCEKVALSFYIVEFADAQLSSTGPSVSKTGFDHPRKSL